MHLSARPITHEGTKQHSVTPRPATRSNTPIYGPLDATVPHSSITLVFNHQSPPPTSAGDLHPACASSSFTTTQFVSVLPAFYRPSSVFPVSWQPSSLVLRPSLCLPFAELLPPQLPAYRRVLACLTACLTLKPRLPDYHPVAESLPA